MKLSRVFPALCALLLPLAAFAGSLTGTWLPTTTYEDGTTITAAVTYRMHWGPEGQSASNYVLTSKPTATSTDVAPGRWCIQVVSLVQGAEGTPTKPACVTVTGKKPSSVTNVQVTAAP